MDEVNWRDLTSNDNPFKFTDHIIRNNGDSTKCPKCKPTCCAEGDDSAQCGSCWFPNGCQKCNTGQAQKNSIKLILIKLCF